MKGSHIVLAETSSNWSDSTLGNSKCLVELDASGKRAGFVDVVHSNNRLAFSTIRVPIGVICGGTGPTVLMTAGSHGDEYEGQVILHRLMQKLTPEDVLGRLIMMPALNLPAVLDGARVSPLDQGNMNRSFAGNTEGGPTQAIAGFVMTHLLPRADAVLDFHSGGTTAEYVDCAFLNVGSNPALNIDNLKLAEWFSAPFTMICPIGGFNGDFDTAAHQQSVQFLSCELGGLGRFFRSSFEHGWAGALRILKGLGVLRGGALGEQAAPATTRFIDIAGGSDQVTVDRYGLAEITVGRGDLVQKGDLVAKVHDVHNFGRSPEFFAAPRSGFVGAVRRNPLVEPGDHLCLICTEIERPDLIRSLQAL